MKTIRRALCLLVALAALGWPATAAADPDSVHEALTGGLVDPGATTLYVDPPRGATVVVYRDGRAAGWLVRPGYLTLDPGRIYGIVATRGTTMLFNRRFRLRPGLTSITWDEGRTPRVSYLPTRRLRPRVRASGPRRRGATTGRARPRSSERSGVTAPRAEHVRRVARHLRRARRDGHQSRAQGQRMGRKSLRLMRRHAARMRKARRERSQRRRAVRRSLQR